MLWMVLSPKYDYTEWVCEYGGPTYEVQDYAEVEAETAREAKLLAIAHKDFREWVSIARSDGVNPLVGVIAEALCPVCMDEQMDGTDNWECVVCGEWWRGKQDGRGGWEYFDHGQRYTKRERNDRLRRYVREHPDYPS